MVGTSVKKINLIGILLIAAIIFTSAALYFPMPVSAETTVYESLDEAYIEKVQFLFDNKVQFYNGKSLYIFSPSTPITRAEYIKYLAQATNLKILPGSSYRDTDKHIYKNYIFSAYENGWLPSSHFGKSVISPDKKITKYDAAVITSHALGLEEYESEEPDFSDYSDGTVNAVSNAYIMFGEYGADGNCNFYPDKTMTYGEAADVLVRAIKYSRAPDEYRRQAIIDYAKTVPVDSESRFFDLLWAVSSQREREVSVYLNLTSVEIEETVQGFAIKKPEMSLMDMSIFTTGNPADETLLQFSYIPLQVTAEEELEITYVAAREVVDSVTDDSMTDTEKLSAIYAYLIKNCAYDYAAKDAGTISGASAAYNALIKKRAVCQGISAAFNLLTEAAGIKSFAVYGTPPNSAENHMWNAVYIDGAMYFCDATWDIGSKSDPKKKVKYFLKTKTEMEALGYVFYGTKISDEYFFR